MRNKFYLLTGIATLILVASQMGQRWLGSSDTSSLAPRDPAHMNTDCKSEYALVKQQALNGAVHVGKFLFGPEAVAMGVLQFIHDADKIVRAAPENHPPFKTLRAILYQGTQNLKSFLPHFALYWYFRPDLGLAEEDYLDEGELWEGFLSEDPEEPIVVLALLNSLELPDKPGQMNLEHPTLLMLESLKKTKGLRYETVSVAEPNAKTLASALKTAAERIGKPVRKLAIISHAGSGAFYGLPHGPGEEGLRSIRLEDFIGTLGDKSLEPHLSREANLLYSACYLVRNRGSEKVFKESMQKYLPQATALAPRRLVHTGATGVLQASSTESVSLKTLREANWAIPISSLNRGMVYARYVFDVALNRPRLQGKTVRVGPEQ